MSQANLHTPMREVAPQEICETSLPASDLISRQYLVSRTNLIGQEKSLRADASFRKSLSPIAKRACTIVDHIRTYEHNTVWAHSTEEDETRRTHQGVFPGMVFSMAKRRMENTKLWKIVQKMPKGCLLHCHLDAMVDFDYILSTLLATPGMHISSDRPLTGQAALENARLDFKFRVTERKDISIWDNHYSPDTFVLLSQAADNFPGSGRTGFLEWLKGRCTLSVRDSHEQHLGIDAIWRKLDTCFTIIAPIIHYEPIFRAFLQRLMSLLHADGVSWVELRFMWGVNYCRDGQEAPEPDYCHMFEAIEQEVAKFRMSRAGKGFWGLTIIWTTLRRSENAAIITDMGRCIATKQKYPNLIAGYDLVGQEDRGKPLVDLLPELLWFQKQCAERDINIPFFFHAGETLGDGSTTDSNLFDAILLGSRRIGHAFSLYKHPLLINLVKTDSILIEACPISNEVLRLCGSILAHPLPALLARGVPCCLSNDDPAILGQNTAGMSHDFWQALQGWDNLGLSGLGSMAENSVRWAAFEDQGRAQWARDINEGVLGNSIKAKRLKEWHAAWEQFCTWIVAEYGYEFERQETMLHEPKNSECNYFGETELVANLHWLPREKPRRGFMLAEWLRQALQTGIGLLRW